MTIVMEMSSGRRHGEEIGHYDDEVLNAGWAAVPRLEARLEEVVPSTRSEPKKAGIAGLMACLYIARE